MEGQEFDSLVKDMSLAAWGRKEIELAQVEMPGNYHFRVSPFMGVDFPLRRD